MEKNVSVYDFIDEKELCEFLGLKKSSLSYLRNKGLPHYKIGSKVYYLEEEVGNWIFEHTRTGD